MINEWGFGMNGVIGSVLPLALGVAISVVPIIAAILMLLSPKAKVTGVGFMLGWIVGIVVAVTAFTLLSSVVPANNSNGSNPVVGTIQLVLGLLLLVVAVRQWKSRPKAGETPKLPKWMKAIDSVTFFSAFGLAFLLAAVNPKNLLLAASAGVSIGTAGLDVGSTVIAIVIFVVIGASTVAVPVIAYLIAPDKLRAPLGKMREWLARENALIMALLMLVIGVNLIGKGIGSF
ncbi:GAP family protein [Microbacterium sp. NPDC076911]|uniref:GAP family protein n=1 Tax=Microbacterium sp. NPDC076911 TaxID=3154958 RepID=UPI0034368914